MSDTLQTLSETDVNRSGQKPAVLSSLNDRSVEDNSGYCHKCGVELERMNDDEWQHYGGVRCRPMTGN